MLSILFLLLIAGILLNALITGFNTLNVIYLVLSAVMLVIHIPSIKNMFLPTEEGKKKRNTYAILYGTFFILLIFAGLIFSPLKAENKYFSDLEQASKMIEGEKYIKAENILMDLHKEDTADVNVLIQLGLLYQKQQRYDESWNYLQSAYRKMPYDVDVLYNMAVNRYQASLSNNNDGLKNEALKYIEAIINISPSIVKAQVYAGQICLELKNFNKSSYYLHNAQRLDPENPIIYYYLAKRSLELMEYDTATEYIKTGQSLRPDKLLEQELVMLKQDINDKTKGGAIQ